MSREQRTLRDRAALPARGARRTVGNRVGRAPRTIAGRVAVVTGGGAGIGRALARALAAHGAHVAIGDLDGEAAGAVAAGLGGRALGRELDVCDRGAFTAFLDEVEQQLGPLDVLVNNAGIMALGRFEDESDATMDRQLGVDLHAVLHGSREAVRRMRPRGTGHIVNVASAAGQSGFPGLVTYCACKHGVVGASEALAHELHGSGVEVTCVMPGVVTTDLSSGLPDTPLSKPVTPEQVAAAIVGALERPRLQLHVPRRYALVGVATRLLPARPRGALARAAGVGGVIEETDAGARAAYEARIRA